MKVLLYFEDIDRLKKSGIGRALSHQQKALTSVGVEFTINPKDDFDIAHINTLFTKSKRLLNKCKKRNIPVIVHGHSTYEDFRNSFRMWKLIKLYFYPHIEYMYKHADMVITPTEYSKSLIEIHQLSNNVIPISNGIDLEAYKQDEEKVEQFKQHFSIKDEPVVIGIGFPFQRKGIVDFFEIARQFPQVKFIWFGHLENILLPTKIVRAIKHRPANVFMPGYIDNSIIKGAMQYAKCLLFPSYEETEGIVVLEALASKCPILVRRIGVYEGWLKENENCFMADLNKEFIDKLNYIMSNDINKITESGYKVAQDRDLSIIGKKLKDVYSLFEKK